MNISEISIDKEPVIKTIGSFIFDLVNIYSESSWIAGSAVRSLVTGETVNDIDIFFKDRETVDIFLEKFKDNSEIKEKFVCPAGQLYTFKNAGGLGVDIQLICHRFYEDYNVLLDSFDFTICQYCLCFIDGAVNILTYLLAIRSLYTKELMLHKLTYPSSTLKRITKYVNRGYIARPSLYNQIVELIRNNSEDIVDDNLIYID